MTAETNMRIASEAKKPLPRRISFTATALAAIQKPDQEKGRVWVYDKEKRGLAFLVTGNDARNFYFCRRVNGRPLRMRLKRWGETTIAQARLEVDRQAGLVANKSDPMEVKRETNRKKPKGDTIGDIWGRFLKEYLPGKRPKTVINYKSLWKNLEVLKNRSAGDITNEEVLKLHQNITQTRGGITANRTMEVLSRLYTWASLAVNPASMNRDELFPEQKRERVLDDAEKGRFFKTLDDPRIPPAVADALRLALYSGARKSNVLSAHESEFDIPSRTWRISGTKTKNGKPVEIHLASEAMKIIRSRIGHSSGFLFPSEKSRTGHITEFRGAWKRILAQAKLTNVHVHDARRTFGTDLARNGASGLIIAKALGHSDEKSGQHYIHLVKNDTASAVDLVVRKMAATARPRKPKRAKER